MNNPSQNTMKLANIRISESTKKHLRDIKSYGGSYDRLLRVLIWICHDYRGLVPRHPILPNEKMEVEVMKIKIIDIKQEKYGDMKPVKYG